MVVGDKLEIHRHPVLLAVGVVDPVVVLCHVIDNVYRVLYTLTLCLRFYCAFNGYLQISGIACVKLIDNVVAFHIEVV